MRRAFELYATGAWSDTALADELELTEAGTTEILTNPLYAGRAIRHKGKPDQEEKTAAFAAPVDPELFDRVQAIRERRRTAHTAGGGSYERRPYPLVRLMRCVDCGSGYHGDANTATPTAGGVASATAGGRPVRPRRPYAAEPYEEQLARVFDGVHLNEADIDQVLAAMRQVEPGAPALDPVDVETARAELQRELAAGELTIDAFSRAWRRTNRPASATPVMPDELRLRRARERLAEFGTLWRNPAVPDRLREEALHEIFARIDVQGPQVLAVHP